jgi:16S rRNA (cytosine967-C5)-methyltransferase
VVPIELACGGHFLKFFFHKVSSRSLPGSASALLKIVHSQKPREIALQSLLAKGGESGEQFIEVVLDKALVQSHMSSADRRLCQELVYGIVRWQATLDWVIAGKTRSRPRTELLRTILRLGLYQLLWLDRIPDHAAVFETVELARQHGLRQQLAFVNGLLRSAQREKELLRQKLADLKASQPSLGYSHPDWLVKRWMRRWDAASSRQLLEWNNQPPPTYARLNTLKATKAALTGAWEKEGVEYVAANFEWAPDGTLFELKQHPPLAELPSFREGMFYVQDPSTLLAVKILGVQPGESVLDLCASPGGKLTYIAQQMGGQGSLWACDLNETRLELVRENCARLGVQAVEALTATALKQISAPTIDRVLVDAPCSNTGVMRRRVDLRWRIKEEEISRLQSAQLRLLRCAHSMLKPNGTLVYSTCSLEREENQDAINLLLKSDSDMELEEERELLPFRDGVDGAYVARMVRGSR